MRTVHDRPAKAIASRHASPVDPLNPLAEEVGKAVAEEIEVMRRRAPSKAGAAKALSLADAGSLQAHITGLVAEVLGRSLSAPTAQGKALRMALIAKLAREEIGKTDAAAPSLEAQAAADDRLLTTADVATMLDASRPHVSMLCDAGKLGEVVTTEGGHRRIRSSAVAAYLAARAKQVRGAKSPREAGVEAGLYDRPEGYFQNVVRQAGATEAPKRPKRPTARVTRKPRP